MIVNSVTELVGSDPILGPVLKEILDNNRRQLVTLLQKAVENAEIARTDDIEEKALALQNFLIGLNVMSKVVTTEKELWGIAKHILQGLQMYAE